MKTVTVALLLAISALCQSQQQSVDFWAAARNLPPGHVIKQWDLNHRHILLNGSGVPREYRNCMLITAYMRDRKVLHEIHKNQCITATDISPTNVIIRPAR